MNIYDKRAIDSLLTGKVTHRRGHGKSMEPIIMDGQKQTLVPVLDEVTAKKLGATHYQPGEDLKAGDLRYITPEELKVGMPVYCKVGFIYTHEIIGIRGKSGELEFQIARHDRKRINGWTRKVYGLCVKAED